MTHLRNSVLATVIYYDIFEFPLTLFEVRRFLIDPGRFSRDGEIPAISLADIAGELDRLIAGGVAASRNGFYFLKGRDAIYDLRMERDKIAELKWKKFLRYVKILVLAPYVRGIFASGSMAINNTGKKSDFDVLVIAEAGRLYTCRFFLWLLSSLAGTRRKRHESVAPDKLCFNHYITNHNPHIPHESIFNAQTYANLKPVMIKKDLFDKFYLSNRWMGDYINNFNPQFEFTRRSIEPNMVLKLMAGAGEFILGSFPGDFTEAALKKYQQKRIRENPKTYEPGGRVIFTDNELEFHPHSFEKVVITKYKEGLRRFGIVSFVDEKDSGLSR